ncbi:MAG: ABC transporter ATP-binding protein, partial [Clostridiales bacterium]
MIMQPKKNKIRPKISMQALKRILSYVADYKGKLLLVLLCILLASLATVGGSLFLQVLIDDYIIPLTRMAHPVFSGLLRAVAMMGAVYIVGVIAGFIYNRLMIVVSQGVLKDIRDDMFGHMQELPIKYFDTHTYGDVMSRYTNDTDTLRQMISQSLPNVVSSGVTIIAVFVAMLVLSWPLTILVMLMVLLMMSVSGHIAGHSAIYFIRQQHSLGATNGYIEEMINGQKVVKAFCHEEQSKAGFDRLNEELCVNGTKANRYANILMPIMSNIGNLQYVLIAIAGGALAIPGWGALTLGAIASFLQLSKSFTMPVSQVAQQLNSVVMALAGAERIFELMDQPVEEDHGMVTLVNACYQGETLTEAVDHTGIWAWKQPREDGGYLYTQLKGDVRFADVDFSYDGQNIVLHEVSLFAKPGQKLAFVGATGAGKTTITNLINRFYDLDDGKIRYDGININHIKKGDLRRSLGVVLQDVNLFSATVMENIRYGRLDATDAECIKAAETAGADSF